VPIRINRVIGKYENSEEMATNLDQRSCKWKKGPDVWGEETFSQYR